ncbi:peptidoglycan-recognition protein LA isoform X1 [Culex quinquefasciatus]|uniref:Peptidoglycan-recognition protein LA n=2 Tax=Culex pipiens TaxID=7175 RepID=A0A8D8FME0_CULPI|nr:peptidoglycan-recognition protein LA isoform X1 [Culex quinquefasciatus]
MDPNTPQPSATPLPESVANALMSINPRYNSFHQHNAIPSMPGNSYNQDSGHGSAAANGNGSNNGNTSVQPATTSVINLSNSSDVVIGPMTQYQGAVTIYQYMDATVEATRIASGRNNQSRGLPSTGEAPSVLRQERYFLYGALILFVIIAFSTALYFVINHMQGSEPTPSQPPILFGDSYASGTIPNLGNGHLVIDRPNWGAQNEVRGRYPLFPPIPYVVITHIGVQSTPCLDMYRCSIKMRTIQDAAVAEMGLPDIPNNFYLGGDGFIYVGRGWNISNAYSNRTLSICFMGDYIRYEPNEKQYSALQHLLAHGVATDHLTRDYKLVSHNQTKNTKSPGPYIYERISKMPRWSQCGNPGYIRCGSEIGLPAVWDQDFPKRNKTA